MAKEYVEYDRLRGHPSGDGLYYEYVLCGGLVSSMTPPENERCPCGNLCKDIGRLGTGIGDNGMRLVRITESEKKRESRTLKLVPRGGQNST